MRILIIDDHALVRRGMALLVLESFPEAEVLEAPPGRDALLVMETTSVDAALFDVRMPTADGLELLHDLQSRWPTVPLIVIATFDAGYARRVLAEGAAGYLLEDATPGDLTQAIQVAISSTNGLSSRVVRNLFSSVVPGEDGQNGGPHRSGGSLTRRETGIFALLAEGRSNRDISRELFLSEKTVKAHLAAIFRKLGLNNRTQAAMAAVSMGICQAARPIPTETRPQPVVVGGEERNGFRLGPRPVASHGSTAG